MFSGTLRKVKDVVNKTLAETAAPFNDEPAGPTEAGVYKNLLVELQYNQLLISREYQQLFKDKEDEIRRLKKLVGEPIEEGDGVESPRKEKEGAKPMKDLSPEDMKAVLREWDRKMKNNIVQKTEALAEAQIYRESVELLRTQMEAMKETIKEQEMKLRELQSVSKKQGSLDQSRADHQAAMEKLVAEFAHTQEELNKTKELLVQADLEIEALRTKATSDARTLEILSKSAPTSDSELQNVLQQREEEWNRKIAEIRDDAFAQQTKLEADLKEAVKRFEESQAALESLRADLQNALGMQADMIARTKKDAEEEIAAAAMERDEAVSKLHEGEAVLKEALEKLAKAEKELEKVSIDHEELVASRSVSSQKDLEMKESALESTRNELYKAQKAVEELRASSDAMVASLKSELEAKNKDIEALSVDKENLESEKSAIAAMGAKSLERAAQIQNELDALTKSHSNELEQLRSENDVENKKAQAQLAKFAQETGYLKETNQQLQLAVDENTRRLQSVDAELVSSKKALSDALEQRNKLEHDLAEARGENTKLGTEMSQLKRQLDETAQRIEREIERVRSECLDEQNRRLKEQSDAHTAEIAKARKETAEFKDLYTKETQLRRQVHDELMDMKGNIRVFARVRPVLPDEKKMAEERSGAGGSEIVTEFPSESGGRDIVVRREGSREGSDAKFEFDKVFDPQSAQEQVFETVAPLIVSVMDGVNVTLFAYGQTGSGKTFTMEGTRENPGVNIRALQRVFEIAHERAATYQYTFTVSVLEVYLETILDLLGDVEARDAREKLDIRQNPDTKQVFVQGLVKKPVSNMSEVQEILQLASKNRTVGAHNMNEHSSRSHLVFTLTAVATSLVKKEKLEGNLNLIDLAGSERVGKTDAQGDRLKEAQSINKSLSALGDVINALSLKNSHIPFRNSKLTYLLQDQLQGNAKVGFFANVSPTAFNSGETMCTLNFANRCRKTELGRAKKNVVGGGNEQLAQENAKLKRQLEELQSGGSGSGTPTPTSTPVRTPVKSMSTSASSKRGLEKD